MSEVREFTIDRSKHARGFESALLTSAKREVDRAGLRCCLGFYCQAHGVSDEQMRGSGSPSDILDEASIDKLPKWLFSGHYKYDSRDVERLMAVNDLELGGETAKRLRIKSEADRERLITSIFAKHGVTVHWTGELPGGAR